MGVYHSRLNVSDGMEWLISDVYGIYCENTIFATTAIFIWPE